MVLGRVTNFGSGSTQGGRFLALKLNVPGLGSGGRRNGRREGEGRGTFFHAHGDGVGDENQSNPSGISPTLNQGGPCAPDRGNFSAGDAGRRIIGAHFIDNDVCARVVRALLCPQDDTPPLFAEGLRGLGKVFAVLTAPRIRGVGGGWQHKDASRASLGELVQALGDEGMPIAVSPANGDVVSATRELGR